MKDSKPDAPPQPGSANPLPTGIKRQFMWSMMPLLVISLVNMVSVPLFYRYLGPDMWALWFYVNTLSGSFGFIDLGLGTAVIRYVGISIGAQDTKAVREYWGTGNLMAIPVLLVMSAVFVGVGVSLGPKWFDKVSPENVRLLQWAFVAGGFSLCLSYYNQFWLMLSQAHFDFKFIGLMRSVVTVVQVVASIWLAYLTGNPVVLIWFAVLVGIVQLGLFVWHARKSYQLGFNLRDAVMARAREMFSISSKVLGTALVGAFGGSLDRLLLGKIAPSGEFVNYNICCNFAARITGLGFAITGPVFHQTSRGLGKGGRDSTAAIYDETFDFTFGFYALASIWTVFWHPVFLRLWLGQEHALQVAPAFMPLVIAFCLSGIGMISASQLPALNRVGVVLAFSILGSLCLGFFAVLGWFWGGLAGMAWGVLASRSVTVAQDLYVIRLIGGGGWLALRTWKHLLAQIVFGGALFLTSLFLHRESYWNIVPAALHGALVAGWLLRRYVPKLFFKG